MATSNRNCLQIYCYPISKTSPQQLHGNQIESNTYSKKLCSPPLRLFTFGQISIRKNCVTFKHTPQTFKNLFNCAKQKKRKIEKHNVRSIHNWATYSREPFSIIEYSSFISRDERARKRRDNRLSRAKFRGLRGFASGFAKIERSTFTPDLFSSWEIGKLSRV